MIKEVCLLIVTALSSNALLLRILRLKFEIIESRDELFNVEENILAWYFTTSRIQIWFINDIFVHFCLFNIYIQ